MIWKHIYNANKLVAGSDVNDAIAIAMSAGYKFMSYNGEILFIDKAGKAHKTDLNVEDVAG